MATSVDWKDNTPESTVHIIPFRFESSANASVKEKFQPNASNVVHFRGRKLFGRRVELPENYTVVEGTLDTISKGGDHFYEDEDENDLEDLDAVDDQQVLKINHHINAIHVWGHEKVPTDEDPWLAVSELIQLSNSIHED